MRLSKIKKLVVGHWSLVLFGLVVVAFFWRFLLVDYLPIPTDTIVGMYHPWRDVVWNGFVAGVPFKNFLITDPVRQQYPWRHLVIEILKKLQLPLWNPYSFAGTPLLANFQSAVFYPLNFLFFLLPFNLAWGVLIFLQPLLAGIFLYLYLRQLGLKEVGCFWGALVFSFSGFFIAWLEWGTMLHSALWLSLILLAIEKIIHWFNNLKNSKFKIQNLLVWNAIFVLGLIFSFFAGHLQVFFYVMVFSSIYLFWRFFQIKNNRWGLLFLFVILYSLFIILASVQWLPTWQFIKLSARGVDQNWRSQPGWFIPWRHLVQFFAPDFFGNPTTLNYWGEWNYGEMVGYLGVIPLILAFWAVISGGQKKEVRFFTFLALIALSFALPTPWAKLPYELKIPLISTSQPTRLLFLVDFCLAILAAFGMESFLSQKRSFVSLLIFAFVYGFLWLFVFLAPRIWPDVSWIANLAVSKRNLILPTGMFLAFAGLIIGASFLRYFFKKERLITDHLSLITLWVILLLTTFDLLRFGWKFTPFVKKDWIFPSTKTIGFLQKQPGVFRFMATDKRIFPPNFSVVYRLQALAGYDPLYLRRYGELIAVMERGRPDISPPFGFNRIIVPTNYNSKLIDLLNVKYILSLTDLDSPKLKLVYQEGKTRVYKNEQAFPRAFIVYDYRLTQSRQETIKLLMNPLVNLRKTVILEEKPEIKLKRSEVSSSFQVKIKEYQTNQVMMELITPRPGILVFTDAFYPAWQAEIDGRLTKVYRANYHFRAIIVPKGKHQVVWKIKWW